MSTDMTKASIGAGSSLDPRESWSCEHRQHILRTDSGKVTGCSLASIQGHKVGVREGEIVGSPASLPPC